MIDRFGEYLELIHNHAKGNHFSGGEGGFDFSNKISTYSAQVDSNPFTLNFSLKDINSIIEFDGGINFSEIKNNRLWELSQTIIDKFEKDNTPTYNRIGLRAFILLEEEDITFEKVKKHLWASNNVFNGIVDNYFDKKNDIGITMEMSSEKKNENIRITFGPYKKDESKKYFRTENAIKEGVIFDVDIWQNNIKIPNFNIQNHVKFFEKKIEAIFPEIKKRIIEEIKNVNS